MAAILKLRLTTQEIRLYPFGTEQSAFFVHRAQEHFLSSRTSTTWLPLLKGRLAQAF